MARDPMVFVALYKLAIGILLVVVALELLILVGEDLTEVAHRWILRLHTDPDNPHVLALMARIGSVDGSSLEIYSMAAGVYGNLHLAEGIGLWLRRHWAEYLTVLSTVGLIPFEVLEFHNNRHPLELLVLGLNVAVVVILVRRVRRVPAGPS